MKIKDLDNLVLWAAELGLVISVAQRNLFSIYLEELWDWNKKVNLTGLTSIESVIRELLLDSLIPSPFLPQQGWLLDIGSGAGFPAIPLKIHNPDIKMHLFETNVKRVSFLRQIIRSTGLSDIEVLRGRIERDTSLLNEKGYHAVTTRAVANMKLTLEWSAPHLRSHGLLFNFQGSNYEKDLRESSAVMNHNQLYFHSAIPYKLPGKTALRNLIILKKI